MKIQLRFFASIRETLNIAQETVELPPTVQTVGDVRKFLHARGGVWSVALAEDCVLRMALNQEMTGADTILTDGCEVAFFPPVTGG